MGDRQPWGPQIVGDRQHDPLTTGRGRSHPGSTSNWINDDVIGERVRQILAERAAEPARLRPFVLKCPNCIAPVEPDATNCTYCNVAYVWEAERSLSKDDLHMRSTSTPSSEVNRPDRSVRGIGPLVIEPLATTVWSTQPQEVFRPTRLYINPDCAPELVIDDIRIGRDSLRRNTDSIPARLCSHGDGIDLFEGAHLMPGIQLTIQFTSISHAHVRLLGAIRGIVLA